MIICSAILNLFISAKNINDNQTLVFPNFLFELYKNSQKTGICFEKIQKTHTFILLFSCLLCNIDLLVET